MTIPQAIFLFAAGVLGGALNAVAGGGSFVAFPALLFTGVGPVAANATNTLALWVGVTASGDLIYVVGPVLSPLMLADLLVRAGAVRGMQLDINPTWPVFASFKPAAPDGLAAPSNGARLVDTYRGPADLPHPECLNEQGDQQG